MSFLRAFLPIAASVAALTAPTGAATGVAFDPATEARLTPEALARYAAPGAPLRYKALIEELKTPPETLGSPARNLRLPVRSFPDGRPRTLVFAEEAWVSPDMQRLRGRRVRMEHLREDGSTEATLEAAEALMDRATMLAVAKGAVRATRGNDVLTGNGALADLDARYVKVLSRAGITTRRMGEANFAGRGFF